MTARTKKGGGRAQDAPIRLDFQSVQQVVVTADREDRFVTTSKEAALACRSAQDYQGWMEEFRGFLGHIHQWASAHSDRVQNAYVGVSSEGLTVVLITRGSEYLLDFDDEVTNLDIELAEKFPSCLADVLQSPKDDPEARIPYISMNQVLQVYGE